MGCLLTPSSCSHCSLSSEPPRETDRPTASAWSPPCSTGLDKGAGQGLCRRCVSTQGDTCAGPPLAPGAPLPPSQGLVSARGQQKPRDAEPPGTPTAPARARGDIRAQQSAVPSRTHACQRGLRRPCRRRVQGFPQTGHRPLAGPILHGKSRKHPTPGDTQPEGGGAASLSAGSRHSSSGLVLKPTHIKHVY